MKNTKDWRQTREATGLSLSEAARRAGLNKGRVSEIETRWRFPTPVEAAALLEVYRKERAA